MSDPHTDDPQWDADVLLKDGSVAQLRPIVPDDDDRLVEFYSRVSDESKYMRFFAPYPELSKKDVERFTHVDLDRRVAFVVTLHDRIIGVGRYDAVSQDPGGGAAAGAAEGSTAEVAFLVEDAHQGRGVGQLLLEHLAQAGRERGIGRFVADVLPFNTKMLQIFREMGYQVADTVEEGVQRLAFRIQSTDTAIGVMRAREQRAEAASIERIFGARSIAVVGASRRQDSIGQAMVRNLVLGDYQGSVYAVNSQAEAVSGLPAYKTVQDVPDSVDLAIVAVPSESVTDVVLDCAAKGVHGLIVISAGFAEEGSAGRKRQRALVNLSRSYGLRLIGPNCLGVINTASDLRMNASLAPSMPPPGRVGFFCQSGALGTAILESVSRRGLGISTFVSAGNRADVSGNDLLQYWQEDDTTEVVLLYLESIGNPRKFSRIARRVSRTKPIVAVKSGRSTQGVPVGHAVKRSTAPQAAVDAMFRQAGVIQVDNLDEMFDVAQLLAHQPLPSGNRVAVVGNSDAMALLVTDAATEAGLLVAEPVSLGANARADDFEIALETALASPDVDALMTVYVPPINTSGDKVGRRARRGGGAVRQAHRLDVPRQRGRARAVARHRRPRWRGRPWLRAVLRRPGVGGARLGPGRRLRRVGLARPRFVPGLRPPHRRRPGSSCAQSSIRHRAARSCPPSRCTTCWRATASTCGSGSTCTLARKRSRRGSSSAGMSCSRPAASTCGPART